MRRIKLIIIIIFSSIIVLLSGIFVLDYKDQEFKEESKSIIQHYLAKKYPEMKFKVGDISLIFPHGYSSADIEVISDDPFTFYVYFFYNKQHKFCYR